MNTITTIGDAPWTYDAIRTSLDDFETLYEKRPIRNNAGGMRAPHMFAVWFICRALSPKRIIESGIWKGQSTWILEQACPDAKITSIDINLSVREYISDRVEYSDKDFSERDWSEIDPETTLVFFDDHQNAFSRIQQCWWFGFQHILFEDNYPPGRGDCYSLKKAFSGSGFDPLPVAKANKKITWTDKLRSKIASCCGVTPIRMTPQYVRSKISPNVTDATFLRKRLQTYYEFPPVFKTDKTRWGDAWDDENYPTPAPLFKIGETEAHRVFQDEAPDYTWICYARMQSRFQ